MKSDEPGAEKKKIFIFFIIIGFAISISLFRIYFEDEFVEIYSGDCKINYGKGNCSGGSLYVPFYNPNDRDINKMKITVPKGTATTISLPAEYNVNSPLAANSTGLLNLVPCENDIDISQFSIEWCCGSDCYQSRMNRPDINISITEEEGQTGQGIYGETGRTENGDGITKENIGETYPETPTMQDCDDLKSYVKFFCISDVAEINGDLATCDLIEDPEIRTFCIARVSLNEDMCNALVDGELTESCIESIRMKKEWSS